MTRGGPGSTRPGPMRRQYGLRWRCVPSASPAGGARRHRASATGPVPAGSHAARPGGSGRLHRARAGRGTSTAAPQPRGTIVEQASCQPGPPCRRPRPGAAGPPVEEEASCLSRLSRGLPKTGCCSRCWLRRCVSAASTASATSLASESPWDAGSGTRSASATRPPRHRPDGQSDAPPADPASVRSCAHPTSQEPPAPSVHPPTPGGPRACPVLCTVNKYYGTYAQNHGH